MYTETYTLAAVGGFLLLLTLIQGTRNVLVLGLPRAAGNQHGISPWGGANDRLNRAIRNLMEALAIFAPIAIAVHVLGLSNDTTVLGAQIFFISRVIHTIVFVIGVPWVRTTAWTTGVIGIVMVGSALVA